MTDPEAIRPWLIVIFRLTALYLGYTIVAKILLLLGPLLGLGGLNLDLGWILLSDFIIRIALGAVLFLKAGPLADLVIRGKIR